MSRSLNRVMLIGNVGHEPEIRTATTGNTVAKFSLATSWGTGEKEKTQWHRITAFGKTADIIDKYVHTGDRLYIEGSIEYSQAEGEMNGVSVTKQRTDIVAREVLLLGGSAHADSEPAPAPAPAKSPFDDDSTDLPF